MTQDVAKTGAARSEDASNPDGSVGVVEEEAQAPADDSVGAIPADGASAGEEDDAPPAEDGEAGTGESEEEHEAEAGDAGVIEELRAELAAAREEVTEQVDKLQRTAAEFQNARRRQERQLSDAIDRANGNLIRRLLPILDDLDLAFQNAPQPPSADGETANDGDPSEGTEGSPQDANDAWISGFRQIQKKLLNVLEDEGVTPIDTSGVFDPELHEAVLSEDSDEVESGHVIGVLRTGYEYKGQVLRPAMVRVAV